ncbi:6-methylsalicylic acid synthase [Aspergillus terreus]|uniref:6-methylsalicylic acid synthase n=1 Tax=Aspergillus terreus TaxID=33178 RepID=A0A5M3Z5G6_ASPTE|nr:hypothetical protein ATETN484_0010003200 [Aspergillus terreus]GFF18082.1 6-methylsalicylic acid synthase [Aspergillus terreus]
MEVHGDEVLSVDSGVSTPPSTGSGFRRPLETPGTEIGNLNLNPQNEVAVVGMACRLAGGNHSPEELWQSILNRKDASGEIPSMRWEPYYRRDIRNPKILDQTTKRGYFLDHVENFDAAFFGVSPKEAEQMDPQQRLSLEVTWEALEDAGIPPQSLSGSETAVFMGVNSDDYSKLLLEDIPNVEAWMGIGTAYCGVPNRISYHLNLMGPSTAVDAACASSLVAIHHGRQAILQGESEVAIVGGVNALCGPGLTRVLDKAGATSSEGRCLSFDEDAKGYGRGEGAAVVILKRLSTAIRDGDHIRAIIKGSAVAQDGKTNGIMAPNAKAQELVAWNALRTAGVDPLTVGYVEAHATSTPLGDPTEVSAVSAVYGKGRPEGNPCFIGSVKPNVGHLEAGAGAVGFIKAVMAVEKATFPPQTNLKRLNSRIDWDQAGVKVVQETLEWPGNEDEVRRAGVCSYGYGGTVSHAIIEEFAQQLQRPTTNTTDEEPLPRILLLSAPQERRLALQARTQASWIAAEGRNRTLESIATTLSTRRGHHDYRAAVIAESHDDAVQKLSDIVNGKAAEWTTSSRVLDASCSKDVVWVFSGHGAQWTAMATDLLKDIVFYQTISRLDPIVEREMGFSALHSLASGDFESSIKVQVLTYLVQVGLAAILRSKGLEPQAVIGHSVGEIAASVAAGCLTAEEGALIVTRRANLYRRVMGAGAMVLVNIPFADMEKELQGRTDLVAAIDSSPSSCVVSGATEAVLALVEDLKSRGVNAFRVKTDIPFHHPMLDQLSEPLREAMAGSLSPRKPRVRLYSTSAEDPRSMVARDIHYWTSNMVNPVRLTAAVQAAVDDGLRLFLEVSSHPIVSHSVRETMLDLGVEDFTVTNTMARNKPADKTILSSIAQLHCRGAVVNWKKQLPGPWALDVPLTTWDHKPFWRHIHTGPISASTLHDVDKHTLLGQRVPVAGETTMVFTTQMDDQTKPFPGSHPLHGSEIVPAAALVNTFLHATGATTLSNITLRVPVAISQPRDIQVVVSQNQIKICSRLTQKAGSGADEGSWLTHTTGQWEAGGSKNPPAQLDIAAIKARLANNKLADNFSIDYLDKVGVSAMGFPWAVTEHYGTLQEMIARVDVAPDVPETSPLPWDAASWAPILDAATSVGSTLFFDQPRLRMPAHIHGVQVYTTQPPPKVGYLYVEKAGDRDLAVHVSVCDELGTVLARFESMRFSEIEGTPGSNGSEESLVHQLAWPPAIYSEKPLTINNVVLVSRDKNVADLYCGSLKDRVSSIMVLDAAADLLSLSQDPSSVLQAKETAVVYVPGPLHSADSIPIAAHSFLMELLLLVKTIVNASLPTKVFVLTDRVCESESATALAQSPIHGVSRIIASEHPDQWGGLIDVETPGQFPLETMKYVQEADNIRISDGIPRIARLRPLPRDKLLPPSKQTSLLPRPEGTYMITGGLGALGLEVAQFLVEKGARRLILVSRRALPPRREWADILADPSSSLASALETIQALEAQGATVHTLAVDISSSDAATQLAVAIDSLSLPPVRGVVHAAGVLDSQLVLSATSDSVESVLAPKITGALVLGTVFPPKALDFFMLFSSCGQLLGFPGQASYASGNAFLDAFATSRRRQGDNAVAVQWTSWRSLGMAASTDFINAELASKGITDITRDEGFRAWMHISKYDIDQAAVLRSLAFEADEPLPTPILTDIAVRKAGSASSADVPSAAPKETNEMPESIPERRTWLDERIRDCVARVLQLGSSDEVDSKAALSDLGVDSVMTVSLRGQLQKTLGVKVPPTLTWSCPTVSHLVGWFLEKMGN